jgi:predicted nucleic acid-binding protein
MNLPGKNRPLYYWDSCIFIAWIKGNEPLEAEVADGIEDIAVTVNNGKANLCTSIITRTEVLESAMTPEAATKFENIFKRRNVLQISLDNPIADRARFIRDYYHKQSLKISVPDSVHLATALIYAVTEFHTLDGSGQRARPNDLLRLNGNVAGYPLLIRVPRKVTLPLLVGVRALAPQSETGGEGVMEMAGKQFGLAIRNKADKKVLQQVWFPLEQQRDEAMATAKLDTDKEFSREDKDCQMDPTKTRPGEWVTLP